MRDKDTAKETVTFVPDDYLASKINLLEITGWLVRETGDTERSLAASEIKTSVSRTQRVLSWFRKS